MKLLADTVESGFFDTFCAAIAQVKMCGSIFPVVEKITGDHGLISYFIHLHEINFLRTTVIYLEMIAHIEEFVINDILEVVGEIVTIIHDADGV